MSDEAPGGPRAAPRETSATQVAQVVWRHADHAAYVEAPERVVVVDLDRLDLSPYVFEGSAAQVWMCVDGDRTESEIVTDLAEAYDVPAEEVGPDVRQFVDRLQDLGLIVTSPVAGSDG